MKTAGQENINHFFSALAFLGVKIIFISPGSRNAPLINAALLHTGIKAISVPDERSAAYMALGAARQSSEPVAVCCTSGTAALNFFPALAEAHYLQVPVLFLTADRPENLLDCWENQVIKQNKMFENYTNKNFSWKGILNQQRNLGKVERLAGKAIQAMGFPQNGPVHINFHFDEPLYFPMEVKIHQPFSLPLSPQYTFPQRSLPANGIQKSDKVLIISGLGEHCAQEEILLTELTNNGYPLLCDIQSPYRHLQTCSVWEWLLYKTDAFDIKKLKPEVLLTTGRQLMNKKLKEVLRKTAPSTHYHVSKKGLVKDQFFSKPHVVTANMLSGIFPKVSHDFQSNWNTSLNNIKKIVESIPEIPFSDFFVCNELKRFPDTNTVIHVSNSMPVRYITLANYPADLKIFCNRGVSGIDGCTSSAAGAAFASPEKQHILITGDLAFFYDRNGLWSTPRPQNLKILILNNEGGNIFDIISGPTDCKDKSFFTTPHQLSPENTAKDFGLSFYSASGRESFEIELKKWLQDKHPAIFEVKTNPEINKQTWNQLKTMI